MAGEPLPDAFAGAMRDLLGAEWPAFRDALVEGRPVRGLRLHRLAPADGEATERTGGLHPTAALAVAAPPLPLPADLGAHLGPPVPWSGGAGWYLPPGSPAGHHVLHEAGAYYLQEPSAMAAAAALAPQPGEAVLDLCAAPGGKATALARLLRGRGLLVANEPDPARARVLARNLGRLGVDAAVTQEAPERLASAWSGRFDAVLVDAPCSGEGLFRKETTARTQWSARGVVGCARRQRAILAAAAALARPGGRILYSTCTFNPEENEAVARWALDALGLSADPMPPPAGWEPGRPEWVPAGAASAEALAQATCRLWPHRAAGEGAFLARFRRDGTPAPERAGRRTAAPGPAGVPGWPEWLRELLGGGGPPASWERPLSHRGVLWAAAAPDLPLAGLTVVAPGLALGVRTAGGAFQPHHHLAMALAPAAPRQPRALDRRAAAAYLAGEALPGGGAPGLCWIHVGGLPLGWARDVGARTNNLYPKALRRVDLVTDW